MELIEFSKANNELDAILLCRQFNMSVNFCKGTRSGNDVHYVELSLNPWTKTIGRTLVEAVNRMSDLYNTAPINHESLSWWSEYINFYKDGFVEAENKECSLAFNEGFGSRTLGEVDSNH